MATSPETPQVRPAGNKDYVILVHGTFSYVELEEGPGWFQRDSDVVQKLEKLLGPQHVVNPDKIEVGGRAERVLDGVFRWSGRNSERSRRLAARKLLTCLRWYDEQGLDYHVVAHSHGGSVLWEGLQLAVDGAQAAGDSEGQPLTHLKSWTTVGTPFFHHVPSSGGLKSLLLLVGTVWVASRQWNWFWDYWRSVGELVDIGPLKAFLAFAMTYAIWMLAPALLILAAYRLFKVSVTQCSEAQYADARVLESYRLLRSIPEAIFLLLLMAMWYAFGIQSVVSLVRGSELTSPVLAPAALYALRRWACW